MMQIQLLALDLDGTVLDSSWNLSNANRDALRRTYDRGVQIVFVTGRRFQTTHPVTSAFDFPHFLITTAGAVTRRSRGERLFAHRIEPTLLAAFLEHTAPYRPWTFLVTDTNDTEYLWCERPCLANPHVARYIERNNSVLTHVHRLENAITPAVLEAVLLGHVDEMHKAVELIEGFPSRHLLKVVRTEYIERDLCLLDVIDGATDKGQAVRQLADSLGIPKEAVMAMGDNHSDLDMLAYAGLPVVMGNAPQELKALGWTITGTNDEDGVAKAIEEFILAGPSRNSMR